MEFFSFFKMFSLTDNLNDNEGNAEQSTQDPNNSNANEDNATNLSLEKPTSSKCSEPSSSSEPSTSSKEQNLSLRQEIALKIDSFNHTSSTGTVTTVMISYSCLLVNSLRK